MPSQRKQKRLTGLIMGGTFALIIAIVWPEAFPSPARDMAFEDPEGEVVEGEDSDEPGEERTVMGDTVPECCSGIPKIDVHVHSPPAGALITSNLLEEQGIVLAFNASGGHPGPLLSANASANERVGGALPPYCHLLWGRVESEGWADYAERSLQECKDRGAVGLKIFKALGLGYTLADGSLLRIDDDRLDPAFEAAGRLGLPVLIHSGDPRAFFEPFDENNERFAELSAHPSWSFAGERSEGGAWPSWEEVLQQFENRVERHPNTTFVGAHFGNAPEDLQRVDRMLQSYPNFMIETGARIPEIGRQDPTLVREFFVRHQDRIMFGSDFQIVGPTAFILGSSGEQPSGPRDIVPFFDAHWRFFETDHRGFASPTPIQGDWTIDAIGLTEEILAKIYHGNALRIFGTNLSEQTRSHWEESLAESRTPPPQPGTETQITQ